jgi:hypothetical protein
VVLATDYPFLDVIWTMFVFFFWATWVCAVFGILSDIFRRHDTSSWAKAGWVFFVIAFPLVGGLVYLGVNGKGMAERNTKVAQVAQPQVDGHVRSVASSGGPADEIDKAKRLLDTGAINADEFAAIKRTALASGAA